MTQALITGDRAVEYERIGDPGAPPLVLVQGLGAQLIGWRPGFCRLLADAGFEVIRFDNRDAGLSQKYPGTAYGLHDMASDTLGLLDALELTRIHLVGQSLGGMIAQAVALTAPERLASLALLYTAANRDALLGERDHDAVASRPADLPRSVAVEHYVADEYYCRSADYPFDEAWIRDLGGQMWDRCYYPEGIHRQIAVASSRDDRTAALRDLRVPTVVIHGDADRLIGVEAGRHLAATIPDARLELMPGMGHELPVALWPDLVSIITANAARGRR